MCNKWSDYCIDQQVPEEVSIKKTPAIGFLDGLTLRKQMRCNRKANKQSGSNMAVST